MFHSTGFRGGDSKPQWDYCASFQPTYFRVFFPSDLWKVLWGLFHFSSPEWASGKGSEQHGSWAKSSTVSIHLSLHLRSEGAAVMSRWDEKKLNMHGILVLCPWDHWGKNRLCAILLLREKALCSLRVSNAGCHQQPRAPSVSKQLLKERQERRPEKDLEPEYQKETPHLDSSWSPG